MVNKLVGPALKNHRQKRLLLLQIIFFDELDSFASGRKAGEPGPGKASSATTRLISVLANEMDKLQGELRLTLVVSRCHLGYP